ncbi:MAG: hypothetical protein NTW87_03555 [Planctomycetota bacterium]|nr:hypothetical protein [Planctomycetota bacterium]
MPASAAESSPPQSAAGDMERALTLCVALLGGTYLVVRPIASQFMPYSGDAAFAGLVAVLLAFCVGVKMLLSQRPLYAPDRLVLAAVLWLGLFVWGGLRSPNLGTAVPQACDAAIYLVLMLCGYFVARRDRALVGVFSRVLVAMIAVEAFAALWQRYVELPRLWAEVKAGREVLPEALQSAMGQARLYGDDAFGSFGNPNSLAAYLLVGTWLLPGLCWPREGGGSASRRQRVLRMLLLVLMLMALLATNSKGGYVALVAGAWFYGAQYVAWP